jgi:hypothetical protein
MGKKYRKAGALLENLEKEVASNEDKKRRKRTTGKIRSSDISVGNNQFQDPGIIFKSGAPGIKDAQFTSLMFAQDQNGMIHTIESQYDNTAKGGGIVKKFKIPGGGAQDNIFQDNIFQLVVEQMLKMKEYSQESIEDALKRLSVWSEDDKIENREVMRAAYLEYLEETGLVPDLIYPVCYAYSSKRGVARLMTFCKAFLVLMPTEGGLKLVDNFFTCPKFGVSLDKKVVDTIVPMLPGDSVLDPENNHGRGLGSEIHRKAIPLLLEFSKPGKL